jgi:hypothetical protein
MKQCIGITGSLKTGNFKRCNNKAKTGRLFCHNHRLQPIWYICTAILFLGSVASILTLLETPNIIEPLDNQPARISKPIQNDDSSKAADENRKLTTQKSESKPVPGLTKLVSRLESFLVHDGAEIKSPDYIEDRVTGELRRVDISIRKMLGSFPILIIIDCKDDSVQDDLQWIEQIAQKKNDIRAAKAVAVSTNEFSNNALRKASFLNIETRLLNQITLDDIADWCTAKHLNQWVYHADFLRISFRSENSQQEILNQFIRNSFSNLKLNNDIEIFLNIEDGKKCSFNQIWRGMLSKKREEIYQNVKPNAEKHRRTIFPNFRNPESRYQIITNNGPIDILEMRIICDLWIEEIQVPTTVLTNYSSKDNQLFDTIGWEFEANGKKYNFNVHRDLQTGQMYISGNDLSEIDFNFKEIKKDASSSIDN